MTSMTVRIPDELDGELRAAAEAGGVSINSLVVDAIRERLEALRHESVMAIAQHVVATDAEILDRLANA